MSPEQARGEVQVTPLADQFSLAAVIFELLAGRRPFTGDDLFAVLAKIVLQEPPRLRDAVPTVPAEVDALVARGLSKEPEERFPSAHAMAAALAARPAWDGAGEEVSPPSEAPTTGGSALSATLERRVVTAVFAGFDAAAPGEDHSASFAAIAAEHGGAPHPMLGRRMI